MRAVYDMVYPILDNANVAYIGITGALAYQLPFEPIDIDKALHRGPADGDDRISTMSDDGSTAPQPAPTNPTMPQQVDDGRRPQVDRYYTNPQPGRQPIKTTGGTYYIGGPQAPPDRYYMGREPGVVDKTTNKMDYYFSYADRLMQTLNQLNRRKIDPWRRVSWSQSPQPPTSPNR